MNNNNLTKTEKLSYCPVPVCNEPIVWDTLDHFPGKVVVAGGCFRSHEDGTELHDWDLFLLRDLQSHEVYSYVQGLIKDRTERGLANHQSGLALSIQPPIQKPIQIVTSFRFDKPEEIIQKFDFTNSKKSVWRVPDTFLWTVHESVRFEQDCKNKLLFYEGNDRAAASLQRALKFVKLGYILSNQELSKILAEVEEERLKNHIDTNDIAFMNYAAKSKQKEYFDLLTQNLYYEGVI